MTRRTLIAAAAVATNASAAATSRPAILGGTRLRSARWPSWPVWDKSDESAVTGVLNSGKWYRGTGTRVAEFEAKYAALTGAKGCLATSNGTSALLTSMGALGISAGDEVVIPPYTFVATLNAVCMMNALPIFADTDQETFQVDARSMASKITDRTAALVPVHMAGGSVDLDTILAAARQKNVPVIEDACQAHLGEWRSRKLGSLGTTGCFSFQASKNFNSGEGGAMLTSDEDLLERAYAFHNNSNRRKPDGPFNGLGLNLRMTEFQGALLLTQMERLEGFAKRRDDNAKYLASLLKQIPGITPAKNYDGCTRSAWHLFMLRYNKTGFNNLDRAKFLKALAAEGIPCSAGYSPLNKSEGMMRVLATKSFKRVYGDKVLSQWRERNECPNNDKLCTEAVWFTQNMLIGTRTDMEQIAEAIRRIQTHSAELAKA